MRLPSRLVELATRTSIIAVEWVALYKLNELLLADFAYSERARWIFLPAALRVIAVLMFGWAGAAGLAIGSYLMLPHAQVADVVYEVMLSLTSGAAPLVAVFFCRRFMDIPRTISTLAARHIIVVSIATAAVNSLLVNACLVLNQRSTGDSGQIATILVGDILGAALMLGSLVLLAKLITLFDKAFAPRDRQGPTAARCRRASGTHGQAPRSPP